MANLPQGFEDITDAQGFLELNSDGAVLSSSGDLENDENVAGVITKMLQTASKMPLSEDKTQAFKRLSLYFEGFTLMATVANEKIFVWLADSAQRGD
ncbi:hypothetical protein ACROYT_G039255 [Oculina patagonica]